MLTHFHLIVIGEGISGLICAREAAKLRLTVASFWGDFQRLVMKLVQLEGYDEAEGLSGMDYAMLRAMANRKAGVTSVQAPVTGVQIAADGI